MYIFRMKDFCRMQCYGTDLAGESQGALLESSPLFCHFHFLDITQIGLPKPNMIIETLLVTFESGKTLFQYFPPFFNIGVFQHRIVKTYGSLFGGSCVCSHFPFHFLLSCMVLCGSREIDNLRGDGGGGGGHCPSCCMTLQSSKGYTLPQLCESRLKTIQKVS